MVHIVNYEYLPTKFVKIIKVKEFFKESLAIKARGCLVFFKPIPLQMPYQLLYAVCQLLY